MIVVDASVLCDAVFDLTPAGPRCSERLDTAGRIVAPEVVTLEILNVARGLARAGLCDPAFAVRAAAHARAMVETVSHSPLVDRAWELRDNLTAYDASYVALAELLGCALVTGDARLADAPGPRCPIELMG